MQLTTQAAGLSFGTLTQGRSVRVRVKQGSGFVARPGGAVLSLVLRFYRNSAAAQPQCHRSQSRI